ncbi:MAG: O-antigen ligase family protein, partial [bacterium]
MALLVFAPLAFGSVHVWAYSLVEIGVFVLLTLHLMNRIVFSKSDSVSWVKTPVNLVLILLFVFIGLQMVPLPPSWIAFFSPKTFSDKMRVFEVIERVADSVPNTSAGGPPWIFFAYYRHPALVEWLKLAAYLGMFFLVLDTARSKKQINTLIYVLVLVGLFEAVYAIFQVFNVAPLVWWWKSRVGAKHLASGTFIVSNHFAGYLEMILSICFGFVIAQKKRQEQFLSGLNGPRALVQRAVSWFSPESVQPKQLFFFFSAILMGLALLLSASRGGILSLGASMLLMSVLFFTKKKYHSYGVLALCLCLFSFIYGLHVGIDPTLEKFKRTEGLHWRLYTTQTLIPMLRDYPVMGVGYGNYGYQYLNYQAKFFSNPDRLIYQDKAVGLKEAHSEIIHVLAETGIIGLILFISIFVLFYYYAYSVLKHKFPDKKSRFLMRCIIASVLVISIHSMVDNVLHVLPITLLLYFALAVISAETKKEISISNTPGTNVLIRPLVNWSFRGNLIFPVVGILLLILN